MRNKYALFRGRFIPKIELKQKVRTMVVYKETDVIKQIHTTLAQREADECDRNGWAYNDLIRLGMQAKKQNPGMLERINKLEKEVHTIRDLIRKFMIHKGIIETPKT